MAKKVTISVPDELHEQMEKWRSSFNFSKIFQKAVHSMIEGKEALEERIRDEIALPDIVKRLRKEKQEIEGLYLDNGKQEGMEWSKRATYADLLHALHLPARFDPMKDERLAPYFNRLFDSDPLLSIRKGTPGKERTEFRKRFIAGWHESVHLFWKQVQDQLI